MFKKRLRMVLPLVILAIMTICTAAYACTCVVVGKDASTDGSVITSHTCDGTYEFRLTVVPSADHAAGSMRPVYKDNGAGAHSNAEPILIGEIPQVAHTYQYFNIAYPFANENQVMMGETTIGSRRGMSSSDGLFLIWELERVGLERAKTAREAIQIMGSIAEEYGYIDGGECLTIVDGKEAWFFEIHGSGPLDKGAVWAAQRIPDDQVGVSANRSRIGELKDDPENFMYSKNVFSFAQQQGWWDPANGPLNFALTYSPKESVYNSRREWRVLDILAPSLKLDPWQVYFPFSVKPDSKVSVEKVMAIKRDHYEGTAFDLTKGAAAGAFGNPNRYATSSSQGGEWERAISIFRCSYVVVMQTRAWLPSIIGGVAWFGEDAPHSTCYMPIYVGNTSVPKSLSTGNRGIMSKDSAWWAFNLVSNFADLKYSYIIQDIMAVAMNFQNKFLAMQPAIEATALTLYNSDPKLARSFLTSYSNNQINEVVETWWKLFDQLAVKYQDGYQGTFNAASGALSLRTVGYPLDWLNSVGFGFIPYPAK